MGGTFDLAKVIPKWSGIVPKYSKNDLGSTKEMPENATKSTKTLQKRIFDWSWCCPDVSWNLPPITGKCQNLDPQTSEQN